MTLEFFHGPRNIAGIGRYLADWQREQGMSADAFSLHDAKVVERAHLEFRLGVWLADSQAIVGCRPGFRFSQIQRLPVYFVFLAAVQSGLADSEAVWEKSGDDLLRK